MLFQVKDFRRVIDSLIIELTLFRKSPLAPSAKADERVPKAFGIWKREDRRDFTKQYCHYFETVNT